MNTGLGFEKRLTFMRGIYYYSLSANSKEKQETDVGMINNFNEDCLNRFLSRLESEGIHNLSNIENEIDEKSFELSRDLRFDEISLCIMGDQYSGKSLILNSIAKIIFSKALVSSISHCVLFFVLNFSFHYEDLLHVNSLCSLIIETYFKSLNSSTHQSRLFVQQLKDFYDDILILEGFPKLNPLLENQEFIDIESLISLGKDIRCAFQKKSTLYDQLNFIFTIPNRLNHALHIHHILYIFEAFDCANIIIRDDFMKKDINILNLFISIFRKASYIITSESDSILTNHFRETRSKIIYSDKFISINSNKQISIPSLHIDIRINDCNGAPLIVSQFFDLILLIEKSRYYESDSIIYNDSINTIWCSFKKLCFLIHNNEGSQITTEIMNCVSVSLPQNINLTCH